MGSSVSRAYTLKPGFEKLIVNLVFAHERIYGKVPRRSSTPQEPIEVCEICAEERKMGRGKVLISLDIWSGNTKISICFLMAIFLNG